jgi:hypothetical protein
MTRRNLSVNITAAGNDEVTIASGSAADRRPPSHFRIGLRIAAPEFS